ncbi:MAG: hypothetical protein DHS80DRAFT_31394 [Piptocephalis tieghemiana]|nr:MAG: hypothetical protein DHS80DRAFT_31394 [Piptocephalis tieghemiana]
MHLPSTSILLAVALAVSSTTLAAPAPADGVNANVNVLKILGLCITLFGKNPCENSNEHGGPPGVHVDAGVGNVLDLCVNALGDKIPCPGSSPKGENAQSKSPHLYRRGEEGFFVLPNKPTVHSVCSDTVGNVIPCEDLGPMDHPYAPLVHPEEAGEEGGEPEKVDEEE